MCLGGSLLNGLVASRAVACESFSSSLSRKVNSHAFRRGDWNAANHSCQSSRGWYGAMIGRDLVGSVGFAGNS